MELSTEASSEPVFEETQAVQSDRSLQAGALELAGELRCQLSAEAFLQRVVLTWNSS